MKENFSLLLRGETPKRAYDRWMKGGHYIFAAQTAKDYGLDYNFAVYAALLAYCHVFYGLSNQKIASGLLDAFNLKILRTRHQPTILEIQETCLPRKVPQYGIVRGPNTVQ